MEERISEALSSSLVSVGALVASAPMFQRRGRGPQKAPRKVSTTIRIDADVLDKFRATGKGWQSRINAVLVKYAPRRRRKSAATRRAVTR
jgi:uncharacterized protein (DUF4415 family)